MKLDFYSEFKNYAIKHMGISSMQLYYWEKTQNNVYDNVNVISNMTPMILEEREMRVTQMSVFDRLMMDRILWLVGPVNDLMSTTIAAQLLWLNNMDSETDITFYIDSPGGSVKSGLSIVDGFDMSKADIRTVNTGMAASMGSILLGAGTKGKRSALPNSKVMLHQVSSGMSGNIQDIQISINESNKYNNKLFDLLGQYCDKSAKDVMKDAQRDLWLTAKEAKEYGIIDEIISKK